MLAEFKQDLEKIEDDFIALKEEGHKSGERDLEEHLDGLGSGAPIEAEPIVPRNDFLGDLKNNSSKNEEAIFKDFLIGSPPKAAPRKIQLSKKKKEVTNEPVLSFFKEEHKLD